MSLLSLRSGSDFPNCFYLSLLLAHLGFPHGKLLIIRDKMGSNRKEGGDMKRRGNGNVLEFGKEKQR